MPEVANGRREVFLVRLHGAAASLVTGFAVDVSAFDDETWDCYKAAVDAVRLSCPRGINDEHVMDHLKVLAALCYEDAEMPVGSRAEAASPRRASSKRARSTPFYAGRALRQDGLRRQLGARNCAAPSPRARCTAPAPPSPGA